MTDQGNNQTTENHPGKAPAPEGGAPEPGAVFGKVDSAGEAVRAATQSRYGLMRVIATFRGWWRDDVIGAVEHDDVIEKRRDECAMSEHYLFMTAMSAGIAVIGLLQSSTAVVIGAMLLSPLMGPIIGLGFAIAISDYQWLKQAGRSLFWGSVLAVFLCFLLVFFSPITTITPEIAGRTQPNLFDLFVALFSGLAGAYAMIRGRANAIVGVAIATALMPPLAVVGFGLATFNWTVFSGALLLYVTNLVTIALTAWGLAKLYGFEGRLSQRQSQFQNGVIILVFFALAVPLGLSLRTIAWEANAQRIVREEITDAFEGEGRLAELDIAFSENAVGVTATMFSPEFISDADASIADALSKRLDREVELTIAQVETGSGAGDAEQAELAAVRASEEQAASARANALANRLSLVAGVPESDVTIDSTRRRATVRAVRLDGAEFAAYRTLEMRIAATEPDWVIELLPPVGDLPGGVEFDDDGLTSEGAEALAVIEWAAKRTGLPIVLTGSEAQAEQAAERLRNNGVSVEVEPSFGPVRADWAGR
ncbi:MAG: TIGR00341 family protein [Erythrobacter sp.]|uniref:TIGR00341 family protein n=1 Tax=Erythrobacter sp. TaxID=1042 RepID=UPI003297EC49